MKRIWILTAGLALGCNDDPAGPSQTVPMQASVVTEPTLYALGNHTCALRTDNVAFCWGKNSNGQLGLRTNTATETTRQNVQEPSGVSFVTMGGGTNHSCGLTADGLGYCWGDNFFGQLGIGGTTEWNKPRPVKMPDGVTFSQISSGGGNFTCALNAAGAAWCWGSNSNGQLGIGSATGERYTPRAVIMPASNFTGISTGFTHACAIGTDGNAYCWGANDAGELGVGSNLTTRAKPKLVAMPVGVSFSEIAAGRDHSCALTTTGLAYCWGANLYGQLGTNKLDGVQRLQPKAVKMPAGVSFTQISAGDHHTCALGGNAQVYCWGYNISGQIGDGTSGGGNERYQPTPVVAPGVSFASVSVKYLHSCAMSTTNQAYCWGVNTNGELGVGDQFNKPTPTPVTNGSF